MEGMLITSSSTDSGALPSGALSAVRFDGTSAQARPVLLHFNADRLRIEAADTPDCPIWQGVVRELRWSEAFRHAPRQALLPDGSTLEIEGGARLADALAAGGVLPSRVVQFQRRWPAVLASLAALVLICAVTYLYGLPTGAKWLAFNATDSIEQRLGDLVAQEFDDGDLMSPSEVPIERQQQIAGHFAAAAERAAPGVRYQLIFRGSFQDTRINAFALPGGTIVLLDGLVLGDDGLPPLKDDQILAVLGHELGHVRHKHVMRRLIQTAGTAIAAAVLWGDFAGILANAPVLVGALQYTREFEREADDFAVEFLYANGMSPSPLLEFFRQLETLSGSARPPAFLSTHPSLRERQQRLQGTAP